jgi:hypothetical protein
MSGETVTGWLQGKKIKSYQIWDTLPLTCNECGRVLDPNEHYSIVQIDDESGGWKEYKICDNCISKIKNSLRSAKNNSN